MTATTELRREATARATRSRRALRPGRAGGGSATSRRPARSRRRARSRCVPTSPGFRARGARRPGSLRFRPRRACSASARPPTSAEPDTGVRARTLRKRGPANPALALGAALKRDLDQAGIAAVEAAQQVHRVGEVAAGMRGRTLRAVQLRCGWRAHPSPATRASCASATLTGPCWPTDRLIAIPFPSFWISGEAYAAGPNARA